MVLLKNDSNTLPLDRTAVHKIAVIGATVSYSLQQTSSQDCANNGGSGCSIDFTTNVRTGDAGSSRVFSDPAKSAGPYAGIMAAANGATVKHYSSATAAQADGFDVAIVIAGLTPADEGEEYTGAGDRTTGGITSTTHSVVLSLDPKVSSPTQDSLIKQVTAMGKPTIVVLEAGGIVDMSQWYANAKAVVMAWYPGHAGRRRARPVALRRRQLQRQAAGHLGHHRRPLADVRRLRAAARRWSTGSATSTSTTRGRR